MLGIDKIKIHWVQKFEKLSKNLRPKICKILREFENFKFYNKFAVADSRSNEGSSSCRNVNQKQ